MKPRSLRTRILVTAAASIVIALAIAGVSLGLLFERQILRRVAQELDIRWTELAAAFMLDGQGLTALKRPLTDPRYQQPFSGAYWQVSEGGVLQIGSRSLWDQTLSAAPLDQKRNLAFETVGPNDSIVYIVERPVRLGGRDFVFSVALDHQEVTEARQSFERDITRVLVPLGLVLSLFAWLQLSLNIGPLRRLGRQLGDVRAGTSSRLESDVPTELIPLVSDLNLLLDRQDESIRKARDRAGALAHGLKTPLTVLAAQARHLVRHGMPQQGRVISDQIEAMRGHVDRELARSRTAGRSVSGGSFTPFEETALRITRLMKHMPNGDELRFDLRSSDKTLVRMDGDDLGEVLGNLLDNARQWARSVVTLSVEPSGNGRARILVEDDGPGFSKDDPSERHSEGLLRGKEGSTGLGLRIVSDILAEYGVSLAVNSSDGASKVSFEIEAQLSGDYFKVPEDGPSPAPSDPSAAWSDISRRLASSGSVGAHRRPPDANPADVQSKTSAF